MKQFFFPWFSILILLVGIQLKACTTAIISGKHTVDGRPILWKHRDSGFTQNKLAYFSDGKYDYIGLINTSDTLGREVWAGFNRSGFAIMNSASYNLNETDTTLLKDREGIIMKKALQNCKTLEDFENLLKMLQKPLGVEANFGVIDAYGGAAYYETNNFTFQKYDVNDPKLAPFGFLIRTNYSFSGQINNGYGYIRYLNAAEVFFQYAAMNKLSSRFVLQKGSRSLKHSLTDSDLNTTKLYSSRKPQFIFFQDYISRNSSVATTVVQGIKPGESPEFTTMWTILGFQLCSVAIPTWITGEKILPGVLTATPGKNAPLCSWATKLKAHCFPIKRGSGASYLNITALMNKEKTGILQKIIPIENEILKESQQNLEKWRQSGFSSKKIAEFYEWIDSKITSEYQKLLNFYEIR